MTSLEKNIIRKSYALLDLPGSRFKHFTFVTRRNKIINLGWNDSKTHPMCKSYRSKSRHSETHAVISFRYDKKYLADYDFYNVRINNNNDVALSKPCFFCQEMLLTHGIKSIRYTNDQGVFEEMRIV